MKIYNYDQSGFFIGTGIATESPLEPGVFLIPGMATSCPPPDNLEKNQLARWEVDAWTVFTIPPAQEPPAPSAEELSAMRAMAYSNPIDGSDRLYAKALRMQMNGMDGWQDVLSSANSRFEEIQAELPEN